MLIGTRPWWQTILATIIVGAFSFMVVNYYAKRSKLGAHSLNLSPKTIGYLFLATLLQAGVQAVIYGVELHSVNHHIHTTQVLTYTGAANLALFVSLTPGAIGIRESFLIFTRHLHHISSANIIVANVIDRSVYIVYLLVLIVIIIAVQAKGKLRIKNLPSLFKQAFGLQKASKVTTNNRQ
jgi:uncharacterized membrane protein YbhN (UPF0104 family)